MKVPTILLAAESLAPGNGGVCRVARLMARVLAEERASGRVHAEAIALSDRTVDAELGLPIRACSGSRLRFVIEVRRALWRHSHVIYDFAGIGRTHRAVRPASVPAACWMHGIDVWDNVRPDYLAVLRGAGLLLSNSAYTLQRAGLRNPEFERAHVCWLATESDEPPPPSSEPRRNTVLIVGRIDAGDRPEWPRYKGHDALIRCWPEVVRHVPNARLVIVGDGPGRPQVEALARTSAARAAIELRGFVSEAELAQCFATARVFAMPSRGEGFGLVYVEAMRHGLPVIASHSDAAPEINIDGETGFNVDLNRPRELPQRLMELLSDPARAEQMGAVGRRRWANHFRYSSFRDRFLAIMQSWWSTRSHGPRREALLASHAND